MPRERVMRWLRERDEWLTTHPEPHGLADRAEYDRLFSARWEQWLDESHGECLLARSCCKALVENSLRHYDEEHYRLEDFVVAANHVHVLAAPAHGYDLSRTLKDWKSFTAHGINKLLGRSGTFWQKECFDHIVRSADELGRFRAYLRNHAAYGT